MPLNRVDFETTCFAKCILAGEHSVLRGGYAVVVPVKSKYLRLRYEDINDFNIVCYDQASGQKLDFNYKDLMSFAFSLCGIGQKTIKGNFELTVSIPLGSGLGGSAALCVALGRWMVWKGMILEKDLFGFSRSLEDFFHGKSSGVDIASILTESPILFHREAGLENIECSWDPSLCLSYSGIRSETRTCIDKVSLLRESDHLKSDEIDAMMQESVKKIVSALQKSNEEGFKLMIEAFALAEKCFEKWGLLSEKLKQHILQLKDGHAMAVKPTGSGLGGYVLSLWKDYHQLPALVSSDMFKLSLK
jgi:mevalonate kinase